MPTITQNEEPQLSSTITPACNTHSCRWRPFSNSDHFEANVTVVIIALFSALICIVSLNVAIRCVLRTRGSSAGRAPTYPQEETGEQKPDLEAASAMAVGLPALVYTPGLKLPGAEAECTICLSVFEEGENIQVLGRCSHGFHVECIQKWLSSHTSCPTCRTSIFSSPTIHEESTNCSSSNSQPELAPVEVQSAGLGYSSRSSQFMQLPHAVLLFSVCTVASPAGLLI